MYSPLKVTRWTMQQSIFQVRLSHIDEFLPSYILKCIHLSLAAQLNYKWWLSARCSHVSWSSETLVTNHSQDCHNTAFSPLEITHQKTLPALTHLFLLFTGKCVALGQKVLISLIHEITQSRAKNTPSSVKFISSYISLRCLS